VEPFPRLAAALANSAVRYVLIGVAGANHYALGGSTLFVTRDFDLLLPADPDNLLKTWSACDDTGMEIWCGDEPLDRPRDRTLAEQVVVRRASTRATDGRGLEVDLTFVMVGFEFETVWRDRRLFRVEGVEIPVARLAQIVQSKAAVGRPKDRLFLATHQEALRAFLEREPAEE
jgi:hypothetical protein